MFDENRYPAAFRGRLTDAWAHACRGRPADCLADAGRVLDEADAAADVRAAAFSLQQMAWACFQLGEVETGLAHARSARRIWLGEADGSGLIWTQAMEAWLLLECGMSELASENAVKAFANAGEADVATRGFATNVLGVVLWYCKHLDRARELCAEAVTLARGQGGGVVLGWWLINLAGVHSDMALAAEKLGKSEESQVLRERALAINGEAIAVAAAAGDGWCLQLGLCNGAEYLTDDGRAWEALELIRRCEAMPNAIGGRSTAHRLYTKAQVLMRFGQLEEAMAACETVLAMAERAGSTDTKAYALRYMSEIHERAGRFEAALALFKEFHETNSRLAGEQAQRRARIAEIVYENGRFREMIDATQRQLDDMVRVSRLDPLTGLPNRRGFDELMAHLTEERAPHSLAMVDLDHFKRINDSYSHLVGDEVLKRVAGALAACCGADHHPVRLGGEEFVLVIGTDRIAAAQRFCETVRRTIAELDWSDVEPGIRVTASIGVAATMPGAETTAILAQADARLYAAKAAGRNRVVWLDVAPTAAATAVA
ncbi:GGDEF domain-containing protein [Aureimonas leprariae]|uniref:diguanylate cyclase n=1 Tax=Plantimonas leprariae TaxID=2615207 RepID=A0A7V7TXV9_9HYPH|nr:tetratricopeptide repeat-containing diguanylate cyclase [Aureimonas leprariae]KAB0681441.1 GGDEF domain-containing protein [Aureimonas leprariae]